MNICFPLFLTLAVAVPLSAATDPLAFIKTIQWTGQNSLLFQAGGHTIAVDPFKLPSKITADIVLLTHSHQDHYSPADLSKITNSNRKIYASFELTGATRTAPGYSTSIDGLKIQAVPAYNIVKKEKHPKANNWVGYILTFDGISVYITGDTERIPEMKNIRADIIILPLGTTYTMNSVEEASLTAADVHAKYAVPVHFGMFEGSNQMAVEFQDRAKKLGIETVLLNRE